MKRPALFNPRLRAWRRKQRQAKPARYYGDGGTIHGTQHLNVLIDPSTQRVIEVWFRCQQLPFIVSAWNSTAARYGSLSGMPLITGVEVIDRD